MKRRIFTKLHRINRGFTLIELMVAVSVFTMIMVISMGSILTVIDANRKSQSLRSVMDNLNYTLESMTRTIRFGTQYHCDVLQGIVGTPRNCSAPGASSMSVRSSLGTTVEYKLEGTRIRRTTGGTSQYLTGTDVTITSFMFIVSGAPSYSNGADLNQPMAIIVIGGYVGSKPTSKSTFMIQTTVSQRLFDTQ